MAKTNLTTNGTGGTAALDGTSDADLRRLLWREQTHVRDPRQPRRLDRHGVQQLQRTASRTPSGPAAAPISVIGGAHVRPGVGLEKAERRQRPWWRRWENPLVGSLVAVVVMVITARGLYTGPMRFDDEGTYVSQAVAVLHGHLAPYTYWYDHPPMGWLVLSLWMGGPGRLFPGPNPIGTGREAMVLVAGLTTVFLYLVMRRLDARRTTSALACLAFGITPLAIEFHRMVLLDNIAVMFLMAALMFAVSQSRRLVATGLSGLSMALAVTSKETTLLMLPFVVWLLWRTRRGETRTMCLTIFGLTFTLPLLYYPLFALLRGELLPGAGHVSLWDGVMFQLVDRKSSGSIFHAGSDAHAVFMGWVHVDWYLLLAGAIAAPLLLANARRRPIFAATAFQALMLVRPGYLPVPFVVVLLPLAALCLGLGVDQVCDWVSRPFGRRTDPLTLGTSAPRTSVAVSALWQRIVAAVVGVGLVVAAALVLPHPLHMMQVRDSVYTHHDFDQPYREAVSWLEANAPATKVVVADNVVWTDLVDRDHRPQRDVVWFTKLGVDSAVTSQVPTWRQIDYVVSSDIMRTTSQADSLEQAISHSHVVASYGQGSQRIEIRQVDH